MLPLRSGLLTAHNHLVGWPRAHRRRAMALRNESPCCVAFYHRVADQHPNGWTLTRSNFQRHIDYFQKHFDLIGLDEVQRRVRDSDSSTPSVAITFDDGYQENVDFALPLLVERQIPCTYFVSTAHVLEQTPFAHDLAAGVPLAINTVREIREWSDAGIEMGCHTRHHVDFSKVHDLSEIQHEIITAKQELEQITGKTVKHFAFPFGLPQHLTQAAIDVVHQAGFEGFCSAYGAYNLVGRDPFHIRRFHGDPEFPRLVNWCSFDQRKVRHEPSVRYQLPPSPSFAESIAESL